MRVLLPFLFGSALALTGCQSSKSSPGVPSPSEPRFHWAAPGLFDSYLSGHEERRLLADGHLAVGADSSLALEYGPRGVCATEVQQKCATDVLVDVVRWQHGLVWLRVDKDGNFQLDGDRGAGPEPFAQPDNPVDRDVQEGGFSGWAPAPRLAADGDALVLFDAPWIHRFEHGTWVSVKLDLGQDRLLAPPGRALLVRRMLYLGVDKGEWGGQLIVADIETGHAELKCSSWAHGPCNVMDIDRGPDGMVYVTCGLAHLGGESSVLMAFDGTSWRTLLWSDVESEGKSMNSRLRDRPDGTTEVVECTSEKWITEIRNSILPGPDGTRIPSAAFVALAFDEQSRPCVLTEILGLWRMEPSGEWHWLTPGWPDFGANVSDLAMVGGKAVITSRTAGVIVVDLETLAAERVRAR